jgi:hypothetical protein
VIEGEAKSPWRPLQSSLGSKAPDKIEHFESILSLCGANVMCVDRSRVYGPRGAFRAFRNGETEDRVLKLVVVVSRARFRWLVFSIGSNASIKGLKRCRPCSRMQLSVSLTNRNPPVGRSSISLGRNRPFYRFFAHPCRQCGEPPHNSGLAAVSSSNKQQLYNG